MARKYWNFRDVSSGLRALRNFLLGRKHTNRDRFPPLISPRSIAPADIPRGPEYKYAANYYFQRDAMHSVKPPVIAPIATGSSGMAQISFHTPPTPGQAWWWDGHCYFEDDTPKGKSGSNICASKGATKPCGSQGSKPSSSCATLMSPMPPKPTLHNVPKDFPIPFLFDSTRVVDDQQVSSEWKPKNEAIEKEDGDKDQKK